jgi:pimeloyl-ACP methyl ester carboxylesterase
MLKINSKDGTSIAYERSGRGSPLVLVHGTAADHTRWQPVIPLFEKRFTVYALDRRGRGASGDAEPYAIELEFEDVAVFCDSISEPVNLLGHSYGAICAMEAAARSQNICRLILYEPPIVTGTSSAYYPEMVSKLKNLLASGDRDGLVTSMLRDVAGVKPEEIDAMRKTPMWQERLATAHTIVREIENSNSYIPDTDRLMNVEVPTLLLMGGDSNMVMKDATEYLLATLPESHLVLLPGQRHNAMNNIPEIFTGEVESFVEEPCYVGNREGEREREQLALNLME